MAKIFGQSKLKPFASLPNIDCSQPLFEDLIGAGLLSRTKQEVIDYMTKKKNFETFFEGYKRKQMERDVSADVCERGVSLGRGFQEYMISIEIAKWLHT